MAIDKRKKENLSVKNIGTGPYLAKVISYFDPSFMGGLEVTLLRDQANKQGDENQTYLVKYLTPFYGSTAYEFMGVNKGNDQAFFDTQKSYGMWFVPPDIGVTVMVMFVDGNPSEGFFVGCVPGRFANHMVPAIGGTQTVDVSPADKSKYATSQPLPVGEVNRKANDLNNSTAIDKIKRPVHPIADRFLEQGTLEDDIRGVTTSTSRRDVPNMVFGISTPGPLDKRPGAPRKFIGREQSKSSTPMAVSRLGGTTFVMDDGDDRYQRKKSAGLGGVEYADILAGEKGDPSIPYNEYFRVRTRTGHQLLMHNSEDLIYIGNSRGTAWVELTSNGKIDIFAEDSISIHTKNDFNFYADRDVNIEAGRNINMKCAERFRTEVGTNLETLVDKNVSITIKEETNIDVGGNIKITAAGNLDVKTTGNNNFSAGGATNILSGGGHTETASVIHMNGPAAAEAEAAVKIEPLVVYENILTDGTLAWASTKYQDGTLESIMKRIPMHEPWALHENAAPTFVTPELTDREKED